ncbi:MAG TPA: EF-Tu/IF-2/RF-3 family GTPase [Thermoplasmata archaeon]|nr:EF-Tu/IF-2/RF-3 family GTPase [Thermoplasmata archaeon]
MTTSVSVAVVGAPEVAKELGKKGTASDLTLFNTVTEGHATTLVEPTQFPEKFSALLTALAMADECLLVVSELTRPIAETIATVELASVPTTVVLGPAVGEGELARALKGGRLENAPRLPLDFPKLREVIDTWRAPIVEGPVMVPVDHAFPVKGVGAVALGVVRRGTLHGHDRLRLWPSPKVLDIRSIQVHDMDRKEAGCGERVGIALKGVDADELSRGQILAPEGSLAEGAEVRGAAFLKCRYYRGDAGVGAAVHLAHGLQVVPAEIVELAPGGVRVTADRPVVRMGGAPAYLIDLSVPAGPRLIGRFTVNA